MIRIRFRYYKCGWLLGLLVLLAPQVWAQKPLKLSVTEQSQLLKEAQAAYKSGLYAASGTLLDKFAKTATDQQLIAEAELLGKRIELMARLEGHRDELELIDSLNVPMAGLALSLERMLLDERGRNHVGSFRVERRRDSLWHFSFTPPTRRLRLESISGEAIDSATRLELIGGEYLPKVDGFAGIEGGIAMPVLLSDGIRIILAQRLEEGLGGYDLYFSRLNTESGQYLRPSLIGLPYSSPANDYILIYDEVTKRTLLVSDRYASEGEVTIYRYRGCPRMLMSNLTEERNTSIGIGY